MNKKLMFVLKLVAMLAILGFVGWKLYQGWDDVQQKHLHVDWGFGALAVLTFAGTMVTSALVWRWLAWRMGDRNRRRGCWGRIVSARWASMCRER